MVASGVWDGVKCWETQIWPGMVNRGYNGACRCDGAQKVRCHIHVPSEAMRVHLRSRVVRRGEDLAAAAQAAEPVAGSTRRGN